MPQMNAWLPSGRDRAHRYHSTNLVVPLRLLHVLRHEIPAVINGEAEGLTQGFSFRSSGLDMGLWCGSETPDVCVWGELGP